MEDNIEQKESNSNSLLKEIDEFSKSEATCLYINSSEIGTDDGVGGMIIDLVSNYITNKKREEVKHFVIYIDEVHRYTGDIDDSTSGLVNIAREGRKKGIFLFLTTQSPKDVPEILLGQIGSMIIHQLTNIEELKIIQNKVDQNSLAQIRKLNQGEAIITSINLLQNIHVHFEASARIHNNSTPIL